jgi:hypothetical protein
MSEVADCFEMTYHGVGDNYQYVALVYFQVRDFAERATGIEYRGHGNPVPREPSAFLRTCQDTRYS